MHRLFSLFAFVLSGALLGCPSSVDGPPSTSVATCDLSAEEANPGPVCVGVTPDVKIDRLDAAHRLCASCWPMGDANPADVGPDSQADLDALLACTASCPDCDPAIVPAGDACIACLTSTCPDAWAACRDHRVDTMGPGGNDGPTERSPACASIAAVPCDPVPDCTACGSPDCGYALECWPEAGRCAAGEACLTASPCLSDRSVRHGVCGAPQGAGAPCNRDVECTSGACNIGLGSCAP